MLIMNKISLQLFFNCISISQTIILINDYARLLLRHLHQRGHIKNKFNIWNQSQILVYDNLVVDFYSYLS